jgi:hypothetical protein
LLHEICHGIVNHYSVPCGEKEEEIVTAMAEGLSQVIMDNPEIARWIELSLRGKKKKKK